MKTFKKFSYKEKSCAMWKLYCLIATDAAGLLLPGNEI